ncbi:hypothetical protein ABWW58_15065 [Sporolactobacillus sp. STCC-11]|uniref:hypothetical protein n=1 Tax=Sporolactobacillus caesalpiniae TaxID=3230362 RepID=UPI003390A1EB
MTYSQYLCPNEPNPEVAFHYLIKCVEPIILAMAKKRNIFLHEPLIRLLSDAIRHADQSFDCSVVPDDQKPNSFFLIMIQNEVEKQFDNYVKKRAREERLHHVLEINFDETVPRISTPAKNSHIQMPFPAFTETEYTLYRMHIIHGYSLSHIAERHRVSQKTVLQWKQRTIETLSRHYMRSSSQSDKNRYC